MIVAGAAGPDDVATGVLQRFGFAPAVAAPDFGAATARLRDEMFDLVVVPLQTVEPMELAALEREVRRNESSFIIGTAPRAESELILRAMRSGVHEFLVFPPDPKDFTAAVDRLTRRGAPRPRAAPRSRCTAPRAGSARRASRSTPRTRSPGTRRARAWRSPTSW
jgi:DNA-binding response OmpR family regulator